MFLAFLSPPATFETKVHFATLPALLLLLFLTVCTSVHIGRYLVFVPRYLGT